MTVISFTAVQSTDNSRKNLRVLGERVVRVFIPHGPPSVSPRDSHLYLLAWDIITRCRCEFDGDLSYSIFDDSMEGCN